MDLELDGKVVLITGGSKGIGLACARAFAKEGARVALVSRDRVHVDRALASVPGALGLVADLTVAGEAQRVIGEVESGLGPIEVLVNSAGAAKRTPPADLDASAWHAAMDAKYFTYIHTIDPVVKRMAQRGRGAIVNVIGNGGKMASPSHIAGGSANAALMLATAGLGAAYASHGVRVVTVNPGLTNTDRVSERMGIEFVEAGRECFRGKMLADTSHMVV